MARTIAGALMIVVLASCSVEESEQSPRVPPASLAQAETPETSDTTDTAGSDGSEDTSVAAAETTAHESAGLRADYNAP